MWYGISCFATISYARYASHHWHAAVLCEDYLSTPVFSTAVPRCSLSYQTIATPLGWMHRGWGNTNWVLYCSTSGTQECIGSVGFHIGQMLLDQWTCQVHMDQVQQSQCQEQLRPHGTQQERYMCRHATTTRVVPFPFPPINFLSLVLFTLYRCNISVPRQARFTSNQNTMYYTYLLHKWFAGCTDLNCPKFRIRLMT